jgi:hypothetical protein
VLVAANQTCYRVAGMRVLIAIVALVGLVQAVVWIGQASAPPGRRVLGVFAAPVAVVLFALALVATKLPGLLF